MRTKIPSRLRHTNRRRPENFFSYVDGREGQHHCATKTLPYSKYLRISLLAKIGSYISERSIDITEAFTINILSVLPRTYTRNSKPCTKTSVNNGLKPIRKSATTDARQKYDYRLS